MVASTRQAIHPPTYIHEDSNHLPYFCKKYEHVGNLWVAGSMKNVRPNVMNRWKLSVKFQRATPTLYSSLIANLLHSLLEKGFKLLLPLTTECGCFCSVNTSSFLQISACLQSISITSPHTHVLLHGHSRGAIDVFLISCNQRKSTLDMVP